MGRGAEYAGGVKAVLLAATAAAICVLAGCGGGGEGSGSQPTVATTTNANGKVIVLGKHHGEAGAGKLKVADLLSNLADTKAKAMLCLKPSALLSDAGESFGNVKGRGAERANRRAIEQALAPTVQAQLRRGDKIAVSIVQHRLNQVERAVRTGIQEAMRNPDLLLERKVPGFQRAAGLADRYGLQTC
jgi:hypothetical protein